MSEPYQPMPAAPPPGYQPPKGPPPGSVVNAVRLMFVIAALGVIGLLVFIATKDELRTAIRDNDSGLSSHEVNVAVNAAVAIAVTVGLILIVLYVLLALQVRKGKNWARITTWVFSGLGLLGALSNLARPGASLTKVVAGVELIAYVALIVLLSVGASSTYFRKRTY